MTEIYGIVDMKLIGPGYTEDPGDPATGKPYLRLTFGQADKIVVRVTANLAEMIGGAGRGMNARLKDLGLPKEQGGES